MGKQLSIYLPDDMSQRLFALAKRQCRRPGEQARYLLLTALEQEESSTIEPHQQNDLALNDMELTHG